MKYERIQNNERIMKQRTRIRKQKLNRLGKTKRHRHELHGTIHTTNEWNGRTPKSNLGRES